MLNEKVTLWFSNLPHFDGDKHMYFDEQVQPVYCMLCCHSKSLHL